MNITNLHEGILNQNETKNIQKICEAGRSYSLGSILVHNAVFLLITLNLYVFVFVSFTNFQVKIKVLV